MLGTAAGQQRARGQGAAGRAVAVSALRGKAGQVSSVRSFINYIP